MSSQFLMMPLSTGYVISSPALNAAASSPIMSSWAVTAAARRHRRRRHVQRQAKSTQIHNVHRHARRWSEQSRQRQRLQGCGEAPSSPRPRSPPPRPASWVAPPCSGIRGEECSLQQSRTLQTARARASTSQRVCGQSANWDAHQGTTSSRPHATTRRHDTAKRADPRFSGVFARTTNNAELDNAAGTACAGAPLTPVPLSHTITSLAAICWSPSASRGYLHNHRIR